MDGPAPAPDEPVEWDVVKDAAEPEPAEQSAGTEPAAENAEASAESAGSEAQGPADAAPARGTIRRRRTIAAIVVLLVVIGVLVWRLTDLGGGGTPKVVGTPAEVVTLVTNLQTALAGRDYQTVCDSLFTAAAREAAGGDNCPSVLAQAGAKITAPSLNIRSVAVGGDQATVSLIVTAAGERPATDELHLSREGGRFRIASAGIVPTK